MHDTLGEARGFRRATFAYLFALALIAGVAVVTHLVVDAIVERQADTARVVNVAGRQRMLSQRIASLAEQLAEPGASRLGATTEQDLRDAIALMSQSHAALHFAQPVPEVSGLFSGPMRDHAAERFQLDLRVSGYLDLARRYLQMDPAIRHGSALLGALLAQAREPVLSELDAAVSRYQADSEAAIARLRVVLAIMLAAMLATLVVEALLIFRPLFRRLHAAQRRLIEAALTDPLTGCRNRRYLMEMAAHEVERARRLDQPLTVLMLDIDRFKTINDTWGHANGDRAILAFAAAAAEGIRGSDLFGRLGGEEFALILPGTDLAGAETAAEKLRARIAAERVTLPDGELRMTVSVGVAALRADEAAIGPAFDRADQALYAAKEGGRNRVESWRPEFAAAARHSAVVVTLAEAG